jgi:hypothetical protein
MLKRIVNANVQVGRNGSLVKPVIGQVFEFTQAEVDSINKGNPKALGFVIRETPAAKPKASVESVAHKEG